MAFAHPRDELLAKSKETGLAVQDEAFAKQLDSEDELKEYRDKFHFPQTKEGKNVVYMVGNSLGPQHKGVRDSVGAFLDKWATVGINGHFVQPDPWFEIDELLTPAMAKIVGAQTSEVALMQTLTANLHLLMAAFYKPVGKKRKILIEKHPFPSDMYAVRSQLRLKGSDPDADLIEVGMEDEVRAFDEELIIKTIEERGDEIAMVMLAGVHFLTGQFFDIERITAVAKKHGCVVGWDLAHAAGNCILKLHDWKVDFACWCTYKYMCSGPGNIGGAFVHSDVDLSKVDRLEGWWGNARQSRFDLKHNFKGTEGAASFQLSNPSVACIASIRPCLEMMAGIGMDRLRKKSVLLTGYAARVSRWLFHQHTRTHTHTDTWSTSSRR